ncbi:MAG: cobalt-precorrin-4 C(11)-methyltransferase [Candidatus Nitrosocaldaceae archaeon]|nr:MAG: cobalt-precorrin-4 C(11)-methyltransferase [Candidatus Nitrosocaldaceae archaeon]
MSKVYFVGAGPGDPELITLKAKKLIEEADVIIYSGSLLNPKILEDARGELYDAAKMDREEINSILAEAALNGRLAIRLHDGDPSIYGAIREQIDKLESKGIECQVIPGISALFAAASRLNLELTLPGVTQTVIITRAESRTPVPDREKIEELAKHKSTMAFYLSVHLIDKVVKELIKGGYEEDTPVAVVYKATWDDEIIIKGKLNDIARKVKDARINKTAIIIVGYVIEPKMYEYSKVYDPNFTHGYRKAK